MGSMVSTTGATRTQHRLLRSGWTWSKQELSYWYPRTPKRLVKYFYPMLRNMSYISQYASEEGNLRAFIYMNFLVGQ